MQTKSLVSLRCKYNKNLSTKTYYRNLRYPPYMAKISTLTYLLEDFERNYCFVDATYVIPHQIDK